METGSASAPIPLALHRPEDGVVAWILALPGGNAYSVPNEGGSGGWVHTNLNSVVNRWVPLRDADLVLVAS